MKKLLLLLTLMCISVSAYSEWVFDSSSTTDKNYVDFSTLKINGSLRKVWTQTIFNKPDYLGAVKTNIYTEFDCKNDTSRTLRYVSYKPRDVLVIGNLDIHNTTHIPIEPDSMEFHMLKTVCKK